MLLWLLAGYAGLAVGQDRRPTISFITQPEIVTDIGGNIEMKCTVNYASDYPVVWMKLDSVDRNNDLPITSGTTMILKDPRFAIDFDKGTSTYTLKLVLIALTDAVKAEVPLIVRRPPIISDNSTRSVVSYEGQRVELRCYASGYPLPDIYWRRQNNDILPSNSSVFKGNILTFDSIKKEHRGTYYCVATNVVGTGARRNIDVEVEFKPTVTIEKKRLGQALQYDKDLECHIEAYPPPAIKWYKDGVTDPISNNQHFRIAHFAFDDEYSDTTLRVITIEKKQYGNYSCVAENKLGRAEGKVELFETVIPI
ncbi:lachesin, partial [Eurytemora carolleeae]|uniref:lachesin n=1 Tax=Eurytemora carolleeae TaxID=1294199 RepID=UPI000C78C5E6